MTLVVIIGTAVFAGPACTVDGIDQYYRQDIEWTDCADPDLAAQCADVTVPLDYSKPRGRTITVAISRIKATDTEGRIGILQTNPGGPGDYGLGMPKDIRAGLAPEVASRYDVIGMDTRGLGRSTPIDCGLKFSIWMRSAGFDRASFDDTLAQSADEAARCQRKYPEVLPFITTRDIARDMDVIRGALGERKTSFFGQSYGTYLGAVYSTMFPDKVDRLVLDSASDPKRYGTEMLQDMGPANEEAVDEFAAWAAVQHSRLGLGQTAAEVREGMQQVIRDAATKPLQVGDETLDEHTVPFVYNAVSSDDRQREQLASTVRALKGLEPPSEWLTGVATYLAHPGLGDITTRSSAQNSLMLAIICGDKVAPRDPEYYWRAVQRARATQPIFGAMHSMASPCAFWAPPRERPLAVGNSLPALILHATRDTRTTYANGLGMYRAMRGSKLVTVPVRTHGIFPYYPNECVAAAVNRYLLDGTLPARDMTCDP